MEPKERQVQIFRRTDDYCAVRELAIRSGLDVSAKSLDDIVVAFGFYIGDSLKGSAALERENGHLFLEWVAVDSDVRMRGIGASLVAMVEDEARIRGMKELWAKALVPEFYRRIGFRVAGHDEVTPKNLDGCQGCPERGVSCHPAIVVKDLVG